MYLLSTFSFRINGHSFSYHLQVLSEGLIFCMRFITNVQISVL